MHGARCAGAPLATMLARRGLRVCLVDKDRFPSDTLSTHGIQPIGVQVLAPFTHFNFYQPAVGQFKVVTGIVSAIQQGSGVSPAIRMRNIVDFL